MSLYRKHVGVAEALTWYRLTRALLKQDQADNGKIVRSEEEEGEVSRRVGATGTTCKNHFHIVKSAKDLSPNLWSRQQQLGKVVPPVIAPKRRRKSKDLVALLTWACSQKLIPHPSIQSLFRATDACCYAETGLRTWRSIATNLDPQGTSDEIWKPKGIASTIFFTYQLFIITLNEAKSIGPRCK